MLLDNLANSEYVDKCVFKGGTSLSNVHCKLSRFSVNQPYPAKPESPDKYTSYHLYISDDLINETVTIGKETLMDSMPYKS